jgi:hypothetical protein
VFSVDTHNEDGPWWAYHHPGFPQNYGFGSDEIEMMAKIRYYASLYSTSSNAYYNTAPYPAPEIFMQGGGFTFKGSAGAASYIVEKSDSQYGSYYVVKDGVYDNVNNGGTIVSGTGAGWYRVRGKNDYGFSDYSSPAQWY